MATLAVSAGLLAVGAPAHADAVQDCSSTADPAILFAPAVQDVTAGDQVSLSAAANGDEGTTSVWQQRPDDSTPWTDVPGTASGTTTEYVFTAHHDHLTHQYRAVFTDPVIGTSCTDAAPVNVAAAAPTVTQDPEDQYLGSGEEATFTAAATGDPDPTVSWETSEDAETWVAVPDAAEATLSFTASTLQDGHYYRAVFVNEGGEVASAPAYLGVDPMAPSITQQPTSTTVEAGTDAVFAMQVTGDPTPAVQWQYRYHGKGYWEDVDGATDPTLTVPAPTLDENANAYRAHVSSDAGDLYSSVVTLKVTGTAPSAPLHVVATPSGPGTVTVTWDPPTSGGSSAITGYGVGWSGGQFGNGMTVGSDPRSATFTDLATGTYTFSVAAVNKAGAGPRTSTAAISVFDDEPTLNVSATSLVAGQSLTASGLGTPGATLVLERAVGSNGYAAISTLTIPSTGRWTKAVPATSTANYRARIDAAASSARRVYVENRLTLGAARTGYRTYTLAGYVYPALSGQYVKVYGTSGGAYQLLGTVRTTSAGRYALSHRFSNDRVWSLKAVSNATATNAAGDVVTRLDVR